MEERENIMRNLIFFDVDGTVVIRKGKQYYIPESTYMAFRQLKEKGNLCFINSGRTMSEMDPVILGIGADGFVCGCGTYISYKDEVLLSATIPFQLGNEVIKDLEKCGVDWLLEGKKQVYFSSVPSTTQIGKFKKGLIEEFSLPFSVISAENAHNIEFDKFCVCLLPNSNFEYFSSKYRKDFIIIDRDGGFYEIVPKGYSKATGIQFLADYFNIPLENTYAVGDSSNDLSMIEFAHTGIVMGDSPENVTKYADYVTDSIMDDGIYNAMKHFNLI